MSFTPLILTFYLGSCGVAVSIAILLFSSSTDFHMYRDHIIEAAYYWMTLYAIVLMFQCFWLSWKQAKLIVKGFVTFPQELTDDQMNSRTHRFKTKDSSSFQIKVFGIGNVCYLITHIVKTTTGDDHGPDTSQIVNNVSLLAFYITFIIFLRLYQGASLKSCKLFHYTIALLLGLQVSVWALVTIGPFWTIGRDVSINITNSPSYVSNCTAPLKMVLRISESFLQPFYVEFLTISIGCLLQMWKTMNGDTNHGEHDFESQVLTEGSTSFIECDYGSMLIDTEYETALSSCAWLERKYKTSIVVGLSIVAALVYVVVYIMLPPVAIIDVFGDVGPTVAQNMFVIFAIVVHSPLFVMMITSLYHNKISNVSKKILSSGDYLLLIANAAIFVFHLIRLFTLFGAFIVDGNPSLSTFVYLVSFWIFLAMWTWVQTQFILTTKNLVWSKKTISTTAKYTLIYLVTINIATWLCAASFAHAVEHNINLKYKCPECVSSLGYIQTKIVFLIFYPAFGLYHFHSAVVAYNTLRH